MSEQVIRKAGRPPGIMKYTEEFINEISLKLDEWIKKPDNFWLGSFAAENGFHRVRLNEFAARNELFRQTYDRAKQIQENKIFMLGLEGKGNPTMCIFALKNVAGWRDIQAPPEDEELKNTELTFSGVPVKNGKLPEQFSRYLN